MRTANRKPRQGRRAAATDWAAIEAAYRGSRTSVRAIARQFGVSDTAIGKRARKHGWRRPEKPSARSPSAKASDRADQAGSDALARAAAASGALAPRERAIDIVLRLLDELDAITTHVGELEEMILDDTAGDESPRRRQAMLKAISHGSRTGAARTLVQALRSLDETASAPGKKEAAQTAAESAGRGTDWGDDLDVGTARVN